MQTKRILIPFFLLTLGWAAAATAEELCQVPRFVVQGTGEANVMILADNSASMNEIVYHTDYDPATSYAGRFDATVTYYVAHEDDYAPDDFDFGWEDSPVCHLVDSDNGQQGYYSGNYLNWLYYNATDIQRAAAPQVTRVQVMKEVLADVLDMSSRIKFGLTIYQNDHFGNVVARCGANRTSILATIDGITANAWTPTGEAMESVLDYFSGNLPSSPIQSPCINNFLIVVTDGYPTMDREVSAYLHDADGDGDDPGSCESIGAPYDDATYHCTDYMDDVAWYMAHEDLRPDLPDDQNVFTYVVGYHVDATLLEDTALNGNGLYFTARNANELRYSIEWAIQDIIRRISAGSAVAVVSTERGHDDRLFRGKFMPADWDGYLECYGLPYEEGDAPIWEAGAILAHRSPDSRRIFTALGTSEHNFTDGNAGDLMTAMNIGEIEEARRVIDWARGEAVDGLRPRHGWRLGDIVHSTPVVVGAPSEFYATPDYQVFAATNADREKTVYVGANDGMLHAFAADDGEELWAFVPELALPYFEVMADSFYCHRYTVDQTVSVRDLQLDGIWRTVLVGGAREGGAGIFALDVTDPLAPDVLWQAETPDGSPFPSQATLIRAGTTAVALVGSGLDVTGGDAWLHAYELRTGNLLGSLQLSHRNNARNKATRPASLDRDVDGMTDIVYVADLLGSVYRIDVNASPYPAHWTLREIFEGSAPITATPALTFDENGHMRIYVGTGAYLDDDDMTSTDPNYFYGIIDRNDGGTATLGSMVDQTHNIGDIGAHDGWYVELVMGQGERITEEALIAAGNVLATSYAPAQDACVAGGESWLYRFYYENGGGPENGEDGTDLPRVESLGEGIASHPVLDLASGDVVVQGSNAVLHVEELGADYFHLIVRSWQESFDYVSMPQE